MTTPVNLEILVGNLVEKCNMDPPCPYCSYHNHTGNDGGVDPQQWLEGITKIAQSVQPSFFEFGGYGEIFRNPIMVQAAANISGHNWVRMISNLLAPAEAYMLLRGKHVMLQVSFHPHFWGLDEAGVERFCDKLNLIQYEAGIYVSSVTIVGYPPFLPRIGDVPRRIAEVCNVSCIVHHCDTVYGDRKYPAAYTPEDLAMMEQATVRVTTAGTKYDHPLGLAGLYAQPSPYSNYRGSVKGMACWAGTKYVMIHKDGNIYPCHHNMKQVMGHITDGEIRPLDVPTRCSVDECGCAGYYHRYLVSDPDNAASRSFGVI